jgi:hypothetical protein
MDALFKIGFRCLVSYYKSSRAFILTTFCPPVPVCVAIDVTKPVGDGFNIEVTVVCVFCGGSVVGRKDVRYIGVRVSC